MSFSLSYSQLREDLVQAFHDAARHKRNRTYVAEFENDLDSNLDALAEELYTRTWKPLPSTYFATDNREVFAARFRDRIVHHLYFNYTHRLFDLTFINDSYACRKGKGTHYGIARLKEMIQKESHNYTRKCYVLSLDIKGYFMHIDRSLLCRTVLSSLEKMRFHKVNSHRKEVWDDVLDFSFLSYLTEILTLQDPLKDAIMTGSAEALAKIPARKRLCCSPKGSGIGIGNLTAQEFSNILLNLLDQFVKRVLRARHYGRYVDDPRIVSASRAFLRRCLKAIRQFIENTLGMELQDSKVRIFDAYKGVPFLGAFLLPFRDYIHNTSLKRLRQRFSAVLTDYRHEKMILRRLTCSLSSFLGTLSHYNSFNIIRNLIPACYVTQTDSPLLSRSACILQQD